jgi:uncharacterized protein YjbI with pentapeptide repeats
MRVYIILLTLSIYLLINALTSGGYCKAFLPYDINEIKQNIEDNANRSESPVKYHNKFINDTFLIDNKNINRTLEIRDSLFNDSMKCISFNGSKFNRSVNFINCTFTKPVEFYGCDFNDKINFFNSTFNGITARKTTFWNDIIFTNCTFKGYIDFSPQVLNSDMVLIKGTANFDKSKFLGKQTFHSVIFEKQANFGLTNFSNSESEKAIFDFSKFQGGVNFPNAVFSEVSFSCVQFDKISDFNHAEFYNFANFKVLKFGNKTIFRDSTFYKPAYFKEAIFGLETDFRNSVFYNTSNFSGAKFKEVDFSNSSFNTVDFSNSEFLEKNETTNFIRSTFLGDAIFSSAKFYGPADFSRDSFTRNVSFFSAIFNEDVTFNDATVVGKLNLNKTKYKAIYIRWLNLKGGIDYNEEIRWLNPNTWLNTKGGIDYNETAYQSLITNFKNLGYTGDANEAYYRMKEDRILYYLKRSIYNSGNFGPFELADSAADLAYGFGFKPERPLIWSLLLVSLFALWWRRIRSGKWGFPSLSSIPSIVSESISKSGEDPLCSIEELPSSKKCLNPSIENPLIFSIAVFLSGTKFFIEPPEIPPSIKGKPFARAVFDIERALGAIFSVLFVIALSRVIIGSA